MVESLIFLCCPRLDIGFPSHISLFCCVVCAREEISRWLRPLLLSISIAEKRSISIYIWNHYQQCFPRFPQNKIILELFFIIYFPSKTRESKSVRSGMGKRNEAASHLRSSSTRKKRRCIKLTCEKSPGYLSSQQKTQDDTSSLLLPLHKHKLATN